MAGSTEVIAGQHMSSPTVLARRLLPYPAAAAIVGAALLSRMGVDPVVGYCQALASLYPAVILASWVGGVGPGLAAIPVGLVLARFVMPLRHLPDIPGPVDAIASAVFVITSVVIVALFHAVRRAERRAEQHASALETSTKPLRRLLDSEQLGIVFWDETGHISEASAAYFAATGYTREQVMSPEFHWRKVIPPEYRPLHERALEEIRRQGVCLPVESEAIRADGTRVPILSVGAALEQDPLRGVSWVLDLTDRKRAEREHEAHRQATERARVEAERGTERLRAMGEGVVRVTTTLSLEEPLKLALLPIADLARELIGAHEAGLSITIDEKWSQTVSAVSLSEKYAAWRRYEDAPDGTGIYAEVCRTNRSMRLTQEELERHPLFRHFSRAAGKHPPIRGLLALPLIGRSGKNLGVLLLSDRYEGEFTREDEFVATQLAQLASVIIENHDLYARLAEGDRRKSEFLAMLGHELRNPLAPIAMAVEVLRRVAVPNKQVQWVTDVVGRQVVHLTRLVDDLLDVSRITRDKIELHMEALELDRVVAQAVETSRLLPVAREREFTVDVPPELRVRGDVVRLAQLVSNLLNNAAKFTDVGGRIALTAERDDGEVVLTVRDDGVGIPPEMLARVFDLFAQVEGSRDRALGGLGIGLTLVKRLVEMHGGTVAARSEGRGRGSEFVVRLPALPPAVVHPSSRNGASARASTAPERPPSAPVRRVLVVDDMVDAAESLGRLLELQGHHVHVVHDGLAALDAADGFRPEIVFLDIGLPGLDGIEVARRLRLRAHAMMIVAMTGFGRYEDRRETREAGFDHHLVKPVDPVVVERLLMAAKPVSDPGTS
jgi:PAS domain S-box-containing protein